MNFTYSQTWGVQGAKWTVDYNGIGSFGTRKWDYVADSVIDGKNVQVIIDTVFQYTYNQQGEINGLAIPGNKYFTYASGDSVFYYLNNQFFLMYNFKANIGDQWAVSNVAYDGACLSTSSVEVVDTGSIVINGISLRTLTLQTVAGSQFGYDGVAIERIGMISANHFGFMPGGRDCPFQQMVIEWDNFNFRCYSDNSLGVYQSGTIDCDYRTDLIYSNSGIQEVFSNSISVWPIPASNEINFEKLDAPSILMLFDETGRLVLTTEISKEKNTVDVSKLQAGIYLMELNNKVQRIIKN